MLQRIVLALLISLFASQAHALDLWRPKGAPAFLDENGDPLAGKLCFYDAGTTDQRTVYKDSAGDTAWTQPITLDSAGRLTDGIYVPTGAFKEVLRSADATDCTDGTVIYTADSIPGAFDTSVFDIDYALPEQPVISKASDYTITTDDLGSVFNVNATGGNVTLTLPSAATAGNGAIIAVRKVDSSSNTAILSTVSSQTIDVASTKTLTLQYQHVTIVSDGANWNTITGIAPTTVTFAQLAAAAYSTDGTLAGNSDTVLPTQKAVKTYVDTVSASGVKWVDPVRVATTANGTLATAFDDASTVDGVTLATGDRILIKNQSDAKANGIYVVAASGAPTRATDRLRG